MTAPHLMRRPARVEGRTLACPHCGSMDVVYVRDMRITVPIARVEPEGELLLISNGAGTGEMKDEWIQCKQCLRASEIPEDLAVAFDMDE